MSIQSDIRSAKLRERIAEALERKAKKLREKTARGGVKISRVKTSRTQAKSKAGRASKNKGSWIKVKKAPALLMKIGRGGIGGISYSMKQENAVLLETNLFGMTHDDLTREMRLNVLKHPMVNTDNVFVHYSISLHPNIEPLSENQWRDIAKNHLELSGFSGCDYTVIRHPRDNNHGDHIHIVASRSKPDGKLVSTSHNFYKWRENLRQVEDKMQLKAVEIMNEKPVNTDAMVNAQRRAERTQMPDSFINPNIIREALSESHNMDEFKSFLERRNIQIQPAERKSDRATVGLLFKNKHAKEFIAGSSIDRGFSLNRIESALAENQRRKIHFHQQQHERIRQQQIQNQVHRPRER